MTDRWECPEDVVMDAPPYGRVVRAVDVPALCRQELMELRGYLCEQGQFHNISRFDAWVTSRFPEAAPEPTECDVKDCGIVTPHRHGRDDGVRVVAKPTPSTTAEPRHHLDKGNVVWRKPPAHLAGTVWMDCPLCRSDIQINAADLAEGLKLAAPPSEAPAKECGAMAEHGGWCGLPDGHTGICRVAAARPEACRALHMDATAHLAECDFVAGHTGAHSSAPERLVSVCTACACERCQALDAFVRALAAFWSNRRSTLAPTQTIKQVRELEYASIAAARKVVG